MYIYIHTHSFLYNIVRVISPNLWNQKCNLIEHIEPEQFQVEFCIDRKTENNRNHFLLHEKFSKNGMSFINVVKILCST